MAGKKTRADIVEELKEATAGSKTYVEMLNNITKYIVENYKAKKVITVTTIEEE